ncbi:MAG: UDP-2,3-diacylglucosamine diphosphatase LpxI [Candidatus Caenarcaniphilales bacterium]|nr:UDP-2,3-diacylglucosamine diphosphatase LpxI [Candidatus Caenarcaniphilales bacterium]
MSERKKRIGIIAGEGSLPRTVSKNALLEGYETFIIPINSASFKDLQGAYTEAKQIALGQILKWHEYFQANAVEEVTFIGKVHKIWALSQFPFFDNKAKEILAQVSNFNDFNVHDKIAETFADFGYKLLSQRRFLKDLLSAPCDLARIPLSEAQKQDLDYGFDMARRASQLKVSQTVIVKDQSVMALEAAEGTDEAIIRGCKLAGKDAVIIKVSWEEQHQELDIPTVGPGTIQTIAKHKGAVLAVEANTTFIIEKEETIELARKYGIALLSI